ncbi:MAG TPA: single-stranded DNA-binding protein [Tepidisphaeraceae bacterium]|nr:single-stranded DNA-binding protein [Tepidisphaeraceae bacterium]
MASFNRVILMGNLTRDPQLRYTPNQTAVCDFGVATNRKYRTASGEEREDVCFVDCSAWGKQAEVINQYLTKGRGILVEGRLKLDTWEDKQGGGKRSKLSVVVENFQFVGGRGEGAPGGGGGGDDYGQSSQPPQRGPARPPGRPQQQPQPEPPFGDEQKFGDDDIPF